MKKCVKGLLSIALAWLVASCAHSTLNKEQAQLHLRIGVGYMAQGHNPQALGELLKAEELDPEDPPIQNNLGLAYYFRKEFALSEIHIKKAIALDPKYTDARNNLARLCIDTGRYDEAVTQLNIVVKDLTYPSPERAFLNLGLVYFRKGELTSSLRNLKKSMESNIKFCPAYNYYGQVLLQQQKYPAAIEAFDQALSLCDNNYDEAHFFSAISFYKSGQKEKAVARLEEVERRYPASEYATKAKNMLKIIR